MFLFLNNCTIYIRCFSGVQSKNVAKLCLCFFACTPEIISLLNVAVIVTIQNRIRKIVPLALCFCSCGYFAI